MYNAREQTGGCAARRLAQTGENEYARASAAYTKARDSHERESHVRNGRSPAETPSLAAAQIARGF
ncbi:hypothetical protein HMPREF1221_00883 [Treponema socranskii subsp. paredis ATCC 35535]|nr:hypothetical protein HMPREF1221_00883 [Treponema socranskii subsp. paredis ATCC 35535]